MAKGLSSLKYSNNAATKYIITECTGEKHALWRLEVQEVNRIQNTSKFFICGSETKLFYENMGRKKAENYIVA